MDEQSRTLVLAVGILVLALPTVVLAKAATRGKVARRSSGVAGELGLAVSGPLGSRRDPLFRGIALLDGPPPRVIANPMRGTYRGREVVLADVQDRPPLLQAGGLGGAVVALRMLGVTLAGLVVIGMLAGLLGTVTLGPDTRYRLVGAIVMILALIGSTVGAVLVMATARVFRSATNHLLILFVEPVPGLPAFLIEPRTAASDPISRDGDAADPGPSSIDDALGPALLREYVPIGGAAGALPPSFFDRASRVLVGRPNRWTVQGTDGRLALWISDWRSPTNLRPSRSYRAVLDDAASLRDTLDPPDAAGPPAAPSSPRATIRASLERIRNQPGPNHGDDRPGG